MAASPEGQWTRDDLPSLPDVLGEITNKDCYDGAAAYRSAALDHLNNHSPKPEFEGYCTCNGPDAGGLMGDCGIALRRGRWRAARAQAQLVLAERQRDDAHTAYEKAERERDEWKARAEAAEARITPDVSRADVAEALSRCLDPEMWNVTFPSLVNEVCDLLGIEAEQAVDPVLDKAQEFAALADWPLTDREAVLLHTVAAHVLGQGADR